MIIQDAKFRYVKYLFILVRVIGKKINISDFINKIQKEKLHTYLF